MIDERDIEIAKQAEVLKGKIKREVERENLPIKQNITMINLMKIAIIIAIMALIISIISIVRTL